MVLNTFLGDANAFNEKSSKICDFHFFGFLKKVLYYNDNQGFVGSPLIKSLRLMAYFITYFFNVPSWEYGVIVEKIKALWEVH